HRQRNGRCLPSQMATSALRQVISLIDASALSWPLSWKDKAVPTPPSPPQLRWQPMARLNTKPAPAPRKLLKIAPIFLCTLLVNCSDVDDPVGGLGSGGSGTASGGTDSGSGGAI